VDPVTDPTVEGALSYYDYNAAFINYFAQTCFTSASTAQTSESMDFSLKQGEAYHWLWDFLPGNIFNPSHPDHPTDKTWEYYPPQHICGWKDSLDKDNWPYFKPYAKNIKGRTIYRYYANGYHRYSPDLKTPEPKDNTYLNSNIAFHADDGLTPNIRPQTAGMDATLAYYFHIPYIGLASTISAQVHRASQRDDFQIYFTPGTRRTWGARQLVYTANQTGTFNINVDVGGLAHQVSQYRVEFYLRADSSPTDVGLNQLTVETIFQHNMFALPQLEPGNNQVTVTRYAGDLSSNNLNLAFGWKDNGADRESIERITASPHNYTINVAQAAMPRMTYMRLSNNGIDNGVAPVISNVQATPYSNSAVVTWTTDKEASSKVIYGVSDSFDLTKTVSGFRSTHSVTLTDLLGNTQYSYRVISADLYGNADTSTTMYFTTLPQSAVNLHVFWHNAVSNQYGLTDSAGPALPADAVIHEGLIASGTRAQHHGGQDPGAIAIGNSPTGDQGRSSFFWSEDLCGMSGSAVTAKVRGEFRDGWVSNAFCNSGPIKLKIGVVSFQNNISYYGGINNIPLDAGWHDSLNVLGSSMVIAAESETVYVIAPSGRVSGTSPSVLDKHFFEIDVTNQVDWILRNSGQWAIVFIVDQGLSNGTGKINLYGAENCVLGTGSDDPWTADGNTAHIMVYGDLQPISVEERPETASKNSLIGPISPNPFKPSTRLSYNLGPNRPGTLQIFDIRGKMVFERPIQGSGIVIWDARGFGSGVYVLKLLSGGKTDSRKLILQR
jgi:hypothetical protein